MRPLVKKVLEVSQTFSLSSNISFSLSLSLFLFLSLSPLIDLSLHSPPFFGKGHSSSSLYLLTTQGLVVGTLTSFPFQSSFQLALISSLIFIFLKLQSLMWFGFFRSNFDFLSFKISNLMGFLDQFFFLDLLSLSFLYGHVVFYGSCFSFSFSDCWWWCDCGFEFVILVIGGCNYGWWRHRQWLSWLWW